MAGRFTNVDEFIKFTDELVEKAKSPNTYFSVCGGTGCIANNSNGVLAALKEELDKAGITDVEVKNTGCPGFCEQGPLVSIIPQGWLYTKVKVDDVPEIVSESIQNGNVVKRLTYEDPGSGDKIANSEEVPFYNKQTRILLANQEKIDPTRIEDYIAIGGYRALIKALTQMKPEEIVSEVSESTVTLLFQLASPLSQITEPLSGPLQVNDTRLTLLKLAPLAVSV